ncbi:MAG: hypothetical protein N3B16_12780 [Candidatus Aminicenantes bacterium]|nr:hypothetical protein [Candidatus Aminicenantes bacterium]
MGKKANIGFWLLLAVLLLSWAGFLVFTEKASSIYNEELEKIKSKYESDRKAWEEEKAVILSEIEPLRAEIESLAKENELLEKKNASLLSDLKTAQDQIASLSDSELAAKVGGYVGEEEVRETKTGSFLFTRLGTERSLAIFYERDAFSLVAANLKTEVQNLNLQLFE